MYRMLVAGDDPPHHVQLDSLNKVVTFVRAEFERVGVRYATVEGLRFSTFAEFLPSSGSTGDIGGGGDSNSFYMSETVTSERRVTSSARCGGRCSRR
jgi:hypothetical protein